MHFCRLNQWNSIAFFCKCMSAIIFLCFVACLCIYICILLSLSKWNGIQANQPRQLCGQPASTLLTCRRANPSFLLLFNVFGVFLVVAVIGCCCCCFFVDIVSSSSFFNSPCVFWKMLLVLFLWLLLSMQLMSAKS